MARSENSSKLVIILIVLIVLGIGLWQAFSSGSFASDKIEEGLTGILTTFLSKFFLTNMLIIGGALILLSLVLFPPNKYGKGSHLTRILFVLLISVLISYHLKADYVYNLEIIKGFIFDKGGKFTFKPLVNTGIIWAAIVFVLPMFSEQIRKFQSGTGGQSNIGFYMIVLIISILIASNIGASYIWEEETFKQGERFLFGDRINGNIMDHTGSYRDGKILKYGILSYQKIKVGDEEVTPLLTFIISIIIFYLAISLLERKTNIPGGQGVKNFIVLFLSAFNANRGSSISTIIALAYYFVVFIVHKEASTGIKIKVLPLAIALFVADTLAQFLIPFKTSGFFIPPLFPESLLMKAVLAFTISFLISLIFGMGSFVVKRKTKIRICKECGSRVKDKRDNKWICPSCSYKCPDCGQQGVEKRGEKMRCMQVGCDLRKVEVNHTICAACDHANEVSKRLRIVCEACDIEIKVDIESEELEGMDALSAYTLKRGPSVAKRAGAGIAAGAGRAARAARSGGAGVLSRARRGISAGKDRLSTLTRRIRDSHDEEEERCSEIEAAATT